MIEGTIIFVHVSAEFTCERCGSPCTRLTRALFVGGAIQSPAERPPGEIVCNDCLKVGRREEVKRYKVARAQKLAQKKWAKGQPHKPVLPGGRGA